MPASSSKVAPKAKAKLTKAQLDKLGQLSLKEKVEAATKEAETPEQAALALKDQITANERGQIWSKRQLSMKGNKEAQENHNQMTKKDKGLASLLWFVENQAPKFLNVQASWGSKETLLKGEKWESELQMNQRFSPQEFQAHIQSGRIQWRHDPWSPGIFNYRDLGDISKTTEYTRKRQHTVGQEQAVTEEMEDQWMKQWGANQQHQLAEAEVSFGGKGQGKIGKGGGGKTGGKGSKGGQPPMLALTNGEDKEEEKKRKKEEEENSWPKCLARAQKQKENCWLAIGNMEEAVSHGVKNNRLTKAAKGDYEALIQEVGGFAEKLKKMVNKKGQGFSLEQAKKLIADAATKVKELKDETKECNQMVHKAASKAASSKAK